MSNRVNIHTKVNGWGKYEHDPWNIVRCRMVMRAGRMDGQMDGRADERTGGAGHDNIRAGG